MSQENSIADLEPIADDFGFTPASFEQSVATYAQDLQASSL